MPNLNWFDEHSCTSGNVLDTFTPSLLPAHIAISNVIPGTVNDGQNILNLAAGNLFPLGQSFRACRIHA
jgi:hypothetical protein